MQKIDTLYRRDFTRDHGRYVTDEVTEGCEWVLAGEGTPTRKYDGTCVGYLDLGNGLGWYARREVKPGKPTPTGFKVVNVDEVTGKMVGWEPILNSSFYDYFAEARRHLEAACLATDQRLPVGTFELVGPKINGNPEQQDQHVLIEHAKAEVADFHLEDDEDNPKGLVRMAAANGWEGIVWHHPDGRMVKLKARDLRREGDA